MRKELGGGQQEKFLGELLALAELLEGPFRKSLRVFVEAALFLEEHFGAQISEQQARQPVAELLQGQQAEQPSDYSSGEDDNALHLLSEESRAAFKKLLRRFRGAVEALREALRSVRRDVLEKFGLDRLDEALPPAKVLKKHSFPLATLIFCDGDGAFGTMKTALGLLCRLQNRLLGTFEAVTGKPAPAGRDRWARLALLEPQSLLHLPEERLQLVVRDFSHSKSEPQQAPSLSCSFPDLCFNVFRALFQFKRRLRTKSLPEFRFSDRIYGTKPFLKKLARVGVDSNSVLLRRSFKRRFVSQPSDFLEFDQLCKLVFEIAGAESAAPETPVKEFAREGGLDVSRLESLGAEPLKMVYQHYCFYETRLAKFHFYQVPPKFCNTDLDEKKEAQLKGLFEEFGARQIKRSVRVTIKASRKTKPRKVRMGFLEFWLTALARFVSRFVSEELDEDDLISENMAKCAGLFPEQFWAPQDFPEQTRFGQALEELGVKNKFVLEVYHLLESFCFKHLVARP